MSVSSQTCPPDHFLAVFVANLAQIIEPVLTQPDPKPFYCYRARSVTVTVVVIRKECCHALHLSIACMQLVLTIDDIYIIIDK